MSEKKSKYCCCEQKVAAKLTNNSLEIGHVEDVATPIDFSFQTVKKSPKKPTKKKTKK